ncbi:MAG TPA: phosphate acyltransferase PlsX [Anaerolineaceae bacterium]|nr:phosphate acyltransferase PlsX [Anaerolineaceae bacterium]
MSIVLDAMGSDQFPIPEIQAAATLAAEGEKVILVGKTDLIEKKSNEHAINLSGIEIADAPDIVEMDDKPVESFKKKPNNSMSVGMTLVKEGKAEAFVTAGNTGAAFFNAVMILRKLTGISRPALAAIIPVKNGKCVFMDTGANADCRPDFLLEFAVMGSVYAGIVFSKENPKVALLSNGEEATKGNQLVKDAFPLLAKSGLNFVGNVEPKEIFAGNVDCVVTDGFSGNVFLKSSEAVAKLITDTLKTSIMSSLRNKIGYFFIKPAIADLKKMMDPSETGAAILLGVNGLAFIGHGRSDARALVSAVKLARRTVEANLMNVMQNEINRKIINSHSSID